LLCFAFVIGSARADELLPGNPAPEIKVAKWVKGTPVAAFEPGKIYVLEYWATWCVPCKKAMPHLSELAKKYDGKVTFIGIDVWERGENTLPGVEDFVQKMGDQMAYNVAYDGPEKFMATNWLKAAKVRGIPTSFVIDQRGKIAWIGHPMSVEPVLEQVIAGKWDTAAAAHDYELNAVDMNQIPHMNQFMTARDYKGAMAELDKNVAAEPGLTFKPYTAHYRFVSLCILDPVKAIEFAKQWIAASPEDPPYSDIVGVTLYEKSTEPKLYLFAADCVETEIKLYGDTSDKPFLLDQQADCYLEAGQTAKALEIAKLALNTASSTAGYPGESLSRVKQKLARISAATQPSAASF
jgi:thiol-disulfide isomerase/thioredoxin